MNDLKNARAALYIRVSTEEQAQHGLSLDAQEDALKAFCVARSIQIIGVYKDAGISGKTPYTKRPAMAQLLEDVERGRVDLILFWRLDRWFRSVPEYYKVQAILEAHKCEWVSISEDYNTTTSNGRFTVNVMLSVNQSEAEKTSERIKLVFDRKKAKGEVCTGSVPFGLRVVDKHIESDPAAIDTARDIYQHYIDTRSRPKTIKWMVEAHGMSFTDRGFKLWLQNRKLVDYGIVTESMYNTAETLRKRRQPRYGVNTFLFSGLFKCPYCGGWLKGQKSEWKAYYYSCPKSRSNGDCQWHHIVNEGKAEAWIIDHIVEEAEHWNVKVKLIEQQERTVDVAAIKRKMDKLTDLYLNDLIDRERYQTEYEACKQKLSEANNVKLPQTIDLAVFSDVRAMYDKLTRENKKAYFSRILSRIDINENGTYSLTFNT